MKYRKKQIVVDAYQYTEEPYRVMRFMNVDDLVVNEDGSIIIPTLEGQHIASKGDYIIRGVKGEYYPCKPDIFEETYEKIT